MKDKITNQLSVEIAKNSFQDEGNGVVNFPDGLIITDDSIQRNGTRYDIESMDLSKYTSQLTADHEDKLKNIIGRVEGVVKEGNKVTVRRIVYAVRENPYARIAYDLLVNGFSKNFSTETIGPQPDPNDNTYYYSELVGLSQVVTQNNYAATVNQLVHNSLEKAKEDGLDVDGIEAELLNTNKETKMSETKDNSTEDVKVEETVVVEETKTEDVAVENAEVKTEDNEAEKAEDTEVETKEVENTIEETKTETVETEDNEITDAQTAEVLSKLDTVLDIVEDMNSRKDRDRDLIDEPTYDVDELEIVEGFNEVEDKQENKKENNTTMNEEIQNAIAEAVKNAFAEQAQVTLDESAVEPEFKKSENAVTDIAKLDWKERYGKQVNAAWIALKTKSVKAHEELAKINEVNLNSLKDAGIVKNAMTIESMGNFILPAEMYNQIVGTRTDYSAILNATSWREIDGMEYAWIRREGDIDMQNVEFCDDDANGNLKPISEYTAGPQNETLEELAAVTVVCTAATRFFAVNLLNDVAEGYRNDYDRKRAQLVIAKFQQAVEESGNSVAYAPASDVDAITAWLQVITDISDTTTNGVLVFNARTFATLKAHAVSAGISGPLAEIVTTGDMPSIFGTPFIIVPNDLMPTLGTDQTVTVQVKGQPVEITHSVFYADLNEFVGFTKGGLYYDVSDQASYEVSGGTFRSAYQRNEMVLRGSFFRGGAYRDPSRIAGILSGANES